MTFMLSVIHKPFGDECRYSECRYAECRYAKCPYAEYRYAECRSALFTIILSVAMLMDIILSVIVRV